jgi:hypothetical protein
VPRGQEPRAGASPGGRPEHPAVDARQPGRAAASHCCSPPGCRLPPEGPSGSESPRRSRPMTAPPCIADCAQPGRGQSRQPWRFSATEGRCHACREAWTSPEGGQGPRRAESGRYLPNVSLSPAVYRLSGGRPRSEMGESSSAPRAADSPTGAAHRLGAAEAHPGEQRVCVRAEHDHDPLGLGHRGLGGDRLLEQRPPPEVGERLWPPTACRRPPPGIRPAFRQRPRDGGDVPIRAGARVPGRSTPSRS